jgi:hypothetical protein
MSKKELVIDLPKRKPPIPIPSDVEEAFRIIYKAKRDFLFFMDSILGFPTQKHYDEWMAIVRDPKLCVLAHRNSSKTTFFGFGYLLWRMFRGDLNEILYISYDEREASRRIGEIRDEIDINPWLKFLSNRGVRAWGAQRFVTKANGDAKRGIEVSSMGISSIKRGRHPNLVYLDDVYNEKSNMPMEMVKQQFFRSIAPMPPPTNGQIIVTGTKFSEDDLFAELQALPDYSYHEYPLYTGIAPDGSYENVFWKEYFSDAVIDQIKNSMPEIDFDREYQLQVVSPKTAFFKRDYFIEALRRTYRLGEIPNQKCTVVASVDLAAGDTKTSAFTVVTIVAKIGSSCRVLDVWRDKGVLLIELSDVLQQFDKKYNVSRIIVEDTGHQIGIVRELRAMGHAITSFTTSAKTRIDLLGNLNFEFQKKRIIIPGDKSDPATMQYNSILEKELLGFVLRGGKLVSTSKNSDTVMSLAFGVLFLSKMYPLEGSEFSFVDGIGIDERKEEEPVKETAAFGAGLRMDKYGEVVWLDDEETLEDSTGLRW